MSATTSIQRLVPVEHIKHRIFMIRGQKVMLDADLAEFYQLPTKRLNEQVKRNLGRFPEDFMFQLTNQEAEALRSQIATLKPTTIGRGQHRKYLPYAFTEHCSYSLMNWRHLLTIRQITKTAKSAL